MPSAPPPADPIDAILALDLGGRSIVSFFSPGAAVAAARALAGAKRVVIVTGFSVPPGTPETDGPPGAAVLGRALRFLGARVRYVTDRAPATPLAAALETLEEPSEVNVYPDRPDAARIVLDRERPTHLVAIERPGRSRSGDYLSARGESIAKWNRPLDDLFLAARAVPRRRGARAGPRRSGRTASVTTLAVGDGGNEIGMGNVRARLARGGRLMARIASVVPVDHLVVAGTSNWGAYGVVAALERLSGRPLLHTGAVERRLIQACIDAGAIDGIARTREPSVDGLPANVHAAIVDLLRAAAARAPARTR